MKLRHEFYPLNYLKRNQKCGVFLKRPQNSGKFTRIRMLHSNDRLTPVHKGYTSRRVHTHRERERESRRWPPPKKSHQSVQCTQRQYEHTSNCLGISDYSVLRAAGYIKALGDPKTGWCRQTRKALQHEHQIKPTSIIWLATAETAAEPILPNRTDRRSHRLK